MSGPRDDSAGTADDSHQEQGRGDRQSFDNRLEGRPGNPTGEKQAAANRDNDPPA
jgi:hypothetical protein